MKYFLDNKDVFIFDLDGVLIDSVGIWNEIDACLIKLLTGKEVDLSIIAGERNAILGTSKSENPYNDYARYLCQKYNIDKPWDEVAEYRIEIMNIFLQDKVRVKPFAVALLQCLKKRKKTLVLATTTSRKNIQVYALKNKYTRSLDFTNIFSTILTMEDVSSYKPNPDVHLKAMELLNVNPEQCVIIEDSLVGVKAANNAGIDVIAVREEHSINDEEEIKNSANYYVDSLKIILENALKSGKRLEKVSKEQK